MSSLFTKHVDCDLCGSSDKEQVLEKNGTFYVRCKTCGFVYANPRWEDLVLEEEVTDSYRKAIESYCTNYAPKKQAIYQNRLKSFEKYRKLNRILEIGCNVGAFLYQAREMGWETVGVEPAKYCAAYDREKYNLDVIPEILENANLPESSFDVVYSNAVFEHLPNPTNVLREIARILRPGGVVYTNTVNYDSYTRELLGASWKLLYPDGHLSLYNPQTIVRFHDKVGLKVLKLRSNGVRTRKEDNIIIRNLRKALQSSLSRLTLKGDRIITLGRKSE